MCKSNIYITQFYKYRSTYWTQYPKNYIKKFESMKTAGEVECTLNHTKNRPYVDTA